MEMCIQGGYALYLLIGFAMFAMVCIGLVTYEACKAIRTVQENGVEYLEAIKAEKNRTAEDAGSI